MTLTTAQLDELQEFLTDHRFHTEIGQEHVRSLIGMARAALVYEEALENAEGVCMKLREWEG
jgi:hypothetical protein